MRIAAGEAGVPAYDGAFADIRDIEGFRAEASGIGAWVVDGRMIDAPFVRRAHAIVALAERLDGLDRWDARTHA